MSITNGKAFYLTDSYSDDVYVGEPEEAAGLLLIFHTVSVISDASSLC